MFLQATGQAAGGLDQEEPTHVLQGETAEHTHTHTHAHTLDLTVLFVCAAPQLAAWNQESLQGDGGVARPGEHRHLCDALQGTRTRTSAVVQMCDTLKRK